MLGPYGSDKSRAAYAALIARYLEGKAKPKPQQATALETIGDCIARYLDHCQEYYRASNEYSNIKAALGELRWQHDRYIEEFGAAMYKEVREALISRPGVTRSFVNRRMQVIRSWVKWCVGEELIDANVHVAIQCIAPIKKGRTSLLETEPVKPVSEAEIAATIKHLPPVVADMVRLQRLLGCRPGEIVRLTPGMVCREGDVWEIALAEHKTSHHDKSRTIYVGPMAQAILTPYLDRGADVHCFSPAVAEDQRHAIAEAQRTTPRNQGNRRGYSQRSRIRKSARVLCARYTSGTYARAILYACRAAWPAPRGSTPDEVKAWQAAHHWSPNQLRHAAGTELRRKAGIEAAQVILGHSEITVTQIYAERDRDLAIATARKYG